MQATFFEKNKKIIIIIEGFNYFFAYTTNFNQNQILNYLLEMSKYKQYM